MSEANTSESKPQGDAEKDIALLVETEKHRAYLAGGLIGGFILLLFVSILNGFPDPITLAAVFSGWVATIITFYFMGQSVDNAQAQSAKTTLEAGIKSEERVNNVKEASNEEVEVISRRIAEVRARAEKIDRQLSSSSPGLDAVSKEIDDMVAESKKRIARL